LPAIGCEAVAWASDQTHPGNISTLCDHQPELVFVFQKKKVNGMQSLPSSHLLRIGRFSEQGRIYLLTSNTKNREPLFADWRVGRLVAKAFDQAEHDQLAVSLAWVVMPDHFHWLMELKHRSLSEVVARTKSRSNLAVNKALERSGSVWQQGFHDRAIRREEDLVDVARYVVLNPVRAGLVRRVGDYPLWNAIWI
jgi:REP element-mobilizing transposase RayT